MSLFASFCLTGFRKIVSHLPLSQRSVPTFAKMIKPGFFGKLPAQHPTQRMLAHFTQTSPFSRAKACSLQAA